MSRSLRNWHRRLALQEAQQEVFRAASRQRFETSKDFRLEAPPAVGRMRIEHHAAAQSLPGRWIAQDEMIAAVERHWRFEAKLEPALLARRQSRI